MSHLLNQKFLNKTLNGLNWEKIIKFSFALCQIDRLRSIKIKIVIKLYTLFNPEKKIIFDFAFSR